MKISDARILLALRKLPVEAARQIIKRWAVSRIRGAAASSAAMEAEGYVAVGADGPLADDGREIVVVNGQRWVLRPDVHTARLEAAFEEARKRQHEKPPEQNAITESIAATACPQMVEGKPCGGALNRRGVCPSCVTGKMGYKYRYTCESCGCDIVTKEELR